MLTVKVSLPNEPERDFHLHQEAATALVDRIRRHGGEARIVPFELHPVLKSMMRACGVDERSIH